MHKTRIAGGPEIQQYAANRLLARDQDVQHLNNLRSLTIWAGYLPDELPSFIREDGPVPQEFPREPIFMKEGDGHVAVSDGFSRVARYENMLENLANTEGMQHLKTDVAYVNDSIEATHQRFASLADSLAEEILAQKNSINTLFIGPLRNLTDGLYAQSLARRMRMPPDEWEGLLEKKAFDIAKQYAHSAREPPALEDLLHDKGVKHLAASEAIQGEYGEQVTQLQDNLYQRVEHPYCDYLLFGTDKVGVNYMYGDQVAYFLDSFLTRCAEQGRAFPRIVMHGKVGGLQEDAKRGDVIIPTGVEKGEEEYKLSHPLILPSNIFTHNNTRCRTGGRVYSVDYVLEQNHEDLQAARSTCSCTEMEFYHALSTAHRVAAETGRAHPLVNFVGYVSDVPLKGDTLATEFTDYRGIYRALQLVSTRV